MTPSAPSSIPFTASPHNEAISSSAAVPAMHIAHAGFSCVVTEGTPDQWRKMLDLNVVALCLCTREALASMKERGVDDGHIIHINRSVCGTLYNGQDFNVEKRQLPNMKQCQSVCSQRISVTFHLFDLSYCIYICGSPPSFTQYLIQTFLSKIVLSEIL